MGPGYTGTEFLGRLSFFSKEKHRLIGTITKNWPFNSFDPLRVSVNESILYKRDNEKKKYTSQDQIYDEKEYSCAKTF